MKSSDNAMIKFIEISIAVISILYGVGVLVIRFLPNAQLKSVLSDVLVNDTVMGLYVTSFLVSGLLIIVGHRFNKNYIIADGLFVQAIIRMFQVVSIWTSSGFFQPTWLTTALVVLLCSTLWIGRQLKSDIE